MLIILKNITNCRRIPVYSKPCNHSYCLVAEIRVMTKRLAAVDIGDVNLDKLYGYAYKAVADGDAGMSVSAGVDDDVIHVLVPRLMDSVYDSPFVVALEVQ